MARLIDFNELCTMIDSAAAIILDHDALSYPYIDITVDDDGNITNEYINIQYENNGNTCEHTFYNGECEIVVLDDGNIQLSVGGENYTITLLEIKKVN